RQAFSVVQNEVTANRDAFDLVAMTTLRNVAAEHGSYGSVPATAGGQAPTRFVASWLAAVAADLDAATSSSPSSSTSSSKAVTSTTSVPSATRTRPTTTTEIVSTTPSQTATSTTSEPAVTTTNVVDAEPTVLDQGGVSAAELN
ncbi:hypothetical protein Q8814_25790, partial [Rhodococcus sp. CC-R104]|nr:hypothetical protein [Rhodococcus sp. CC-R104]